MYKVREHDMRKHRLGEEELKQLHREQLRKEEQEKREREEKARRKREEDIQREIQGVCICACGREEPFSLPIPGDHLVQRNCQFSGAGLSHGLPKFTTACPVVVLIAESGMALV